MVLERMATALQSTNVYEIGFFIAGGFLFGKCCDQIPCEVGTDGACGVDNDVD